MLSARVKLLRLFPTSASPRWRVDSPCSLTSSATLAQGDKVLAIRREESSVWERRAPLSPYHVHAIVKKGIKVTSDVVKYVYICVYFLMLLWGN